MNAMRISTLVVCLSGITALYSATGCIDNSKHTDTRDGYDYKTYHFVGCTCDCKRYTHLESRAQCLRCGHYRIQ